MAMDEIVKYLRDEMRAGFEAIKALRLEDRALSSQRHSENVERFRKQDGKLDDIDDQVRTTNGRLTKAEEQIKILFRGKCWIDGKEHKADEPKDDERPLTRIDFRYLILAFGAGAGALAWLYHLSGKG